MDKPLSERIIKRLKALAWDPYPADAKRVIGRKDKVFRIRVGDYRVLYAVDWDKRSVLVVSIDKRSKVYET